MKVEVAVPVLMSLGFCGRKATLNHAWALHGHSLSLICQLTSEDTKRYTTIIINQSIFYFMSVHIEVILDKKQNKKQTNKKTYNYYLY